MNRSRNLLSPTLLLCLSFFVLSCSRKTTAYSGSDAFKSENGVPNYSELQFWAAHPDKWDPSDTIPTPLITEPKEKVADVFFLHPTTLTGVRENGITNASIDDSVINYKTDYSPILYQASAFNERARIFAPRYRQAHIGMYAEPDSASKYAAFNLAYDDIKKRFYITWSTKTKEGQLSLRLIVRVPPTQPVCSKNFLTKSHCTINWSVLI